MKNAVEAIEGAGIEAIKDPVITVQLREEGDKARVSVSDNGKGWPKENRQRLLEPYITTREKGTGLGLAIVARIIEQHGGSVDLVDAEPDANGRIGACFTFTLLLNNADADDDADVTPQSGREGESAPGADRQEEPPVEAEMKT
jgi:two-component system nitrogen regulation sensor histidine kinase NtrY